MFLGADSKFLDAIADPDLSPLSQDKWNLWMQCSASDKEKVSQTTGMRSDLNLPFDRAHPKSLLPALDASHIVMCIDHGFTRVVENLVMKVVRTCLDLESRLVHYLLSFLMSYQKVNSRSILQFHYTIFSQVNARPQINAENNRMSFKSSHVDSQGYVEVQGSS